MLTFTPNLTQPQKTKVLNYMKITKALRPKKVKIIPKKILDFLLPGEKKLLAEAMKNRKDIKSKEFSVRFFKH